MRIKASLVAATLVTGTLAAGGIVPSSAQVPPPIVLEPLSPRSSFTDPITAQFKVKLDGRRTHVIKSRDLSRSVVARITVQPGAMFPWHTHAGPVVVNVAQGELVYVSADDCVERPYPAGTAFVDPGRGHVHTAFNRGADVLVFYATFFEVPAEGPLTITQGIQAPAGCVTGP
jgi:quercetin dioxygenase-like cupin family protein